MLTCPDSRIAPELVFDQGLGDVFDVRVAGNIVDEAVLGSLEYAVEHLHVPVIVVMGHDHCGAIHAAMQHEHPHNHINAIIRSLSPAVALAKGNETQASVQNVRLILEKLKQSPVIRHQLAQGQLMLKGALYHLETETVEFLPDTL